MKPFIITLSLFLAITGFAQPKPTELDKSPMDMSYWPANYPILKMSGKAKDLPIARIIYGRPMKNGRVIFGGIIKYGEMWRLGANEATEIETFRTIKIAGKTLAKGRYTVYCLPTENKWTIIINKDNFCWGNFTYDLKKDLIRSEIDVEKNTESVEAFTMYFEDTKNGANLIFLWDDIKTSLPIILVEDTKSKKN
jgi:Protein of unknown function (DUF2911)